MSDAPKKTTGTLKLGLPAKRSTDTDTDPAQNRVRSGARARRVAQMAHQQPAEPAPQDEPTAAARPARGRAAPRRSAGQPTTDTPPRQTSPTPRRSSRPLPAGQPARSNTPDDRFGSRTRPRPEAPLTAADHPRSSRPAPAHRPNTDRRPDGNRRPAPVRSSKLAITLPTGTEFAIFTPCPQGLEAALATELQALGFTPRAVRAGCHLQADWAGMQRINLHSRLATRVLLQVSHAPVQTEDDILHLAQATPWERWFGPEHTLRVDTSAVRSPMNSLHYCNLRAKDGICDRLREREGARPSIDTVRPDARVHLFLDQDSATLYLDTSGESLFKRGWRFHKGDAPIRENLAAGMLALSGWQPGQALLDPFCGSGTILIEAAWQALNIPPGIMRPFAFERLRNHDPADWQAVKEHARAQTRDTLDAPLVGVDLDADTLAAARANTQRAGLPSDLIQFQVGDACQFQPPSPTGHIVTNPPYGERLTEHSDELWPAWASHLKRHYSGWQVHVISNDLRLPQQLRLQAKRRHPLFNGPLDCRLFSFDMVASHYQA